MHNELDLLPVFILAIAADSDSKKKVIHKFHRAAHVTAIWVGSGNAYVATDIDYQKLRFYNDTTSTLVAQLDTGPASTGQALAAGVPVICPTMTTGDFSAGDVLTLSPLKAGAGMALADVTIDVRGYYTD